RRSSDLFRAFVISISSIILSSFRVSHIQDMARDDFGSWGSPHPMFQDGLGIPRRHHHRSTRRFLGRRSRSHRNSPGLTPEHNKSPEPMTVGRRSCPQGLLVFSYLISAVPQLGMLDGSAGALNSRQLPHALESVANSFRHSASSRSSSRARLNISAKPWPRFL